MFSIPGQCGMTVISYDELLERDKVNLDIFWLKDEPSEESAKRLKPCCNRWNYRVMTGRGESERQAK